MKKALIFLAGIAVSVAAQADGKAFSGTAGTSIATGDCQALLEDVTINSSASVNGYADCPDTYTISVAACHEAGRKDSSGNVYIFNGSSAGGTVSAVNTQTECTADTVNSVATGSGS